MSEAHAVCFSIAARGDVGVHAAIARPKRTLITLACLLALTIIGCSTTEDTTYVGYEMGNAPPVERREVNERTPLPPLATLEVLSGDTVRVPSGKILRLAGIRAPAPGEPYHQTARQWLRSLVRNQIVRLTYLVDTRYTDAVWNVNILVPNREPGAGGALSANALMLANGLATEAPGIDSLRFATVTDGGRLTPLGEERDAAIRSLFTSAANTARVNRANIFSGVHAP